MQVIKGGTIASDISTSCCAFNVKRIQTLINYMSMHRSMDGNVETAMRAERERCALKGSDARWRAAYGAAQRAHDCLCLRFLVGVESEDARARAAFIFLCSALTTYYVPVL